MPRMNMRRTHRLGMAAVMALEAYNRRHLDRVLYELVSLRASHLNGCRYCITLHSRELRRGGQDEDRIAELATEPTRERFTDRELAALALTDAITHLGRGGVEDATWDRASAHFTQTELGDLVLGIAAINTWNRIAIATRIAP